MNGANGLSTQTHTLTVHIQQAHTHTHSHCTHTHTVHRQYTWEALSTPWEMVM